MDGTQATRQETLYEGDDVTDDGGVRHKGWKTSRGPSSRHIYQNVRPTR